MSAGKKVGKNVSAGKKSSTKKSALGAKKPVAKSSKASAKKKVTLGSKKLAPKANKAKSGKVSKK